VPEEFWDYSHETNLPYLDFVEYIATPYVANLLIADDLNVSVLIADETRLASKDYGMMYHSDDSDEIDNIMMDIANPGPGALDDFNEWVSGFELSFAFQR